MVSRGSYDSHWPTPWSIAVLDQRIYSMALNSEQVIGDRKASTVLSSGFLYKPAMGTYI